MTSIKPSKESPRIEIGISGDCRKVPLDPDLVARVEEFEQASENQRQKDVYAFYGLAMYHAQVLEAGLKNLLVAYARAFDDLSPEDVDTYEERFATDTLGRMLSRMRSLINIDNNASHLLQHALKERNRLAHRYFYERIELLYGAAGQLRVVKELTNLTQLFRHADLLFEPLQKSLFKEIGLSEEFLGKQLQVMVANAKKKYAD